MIKNGQIDHYRKKLPDIFGNVLKAVTGTFRNFVQKQKTNLEFQRIFDNPLGKYLIYKEFLEGNDYISIYLQKSE